MLFIQFRNSCQQAYSLEEYYFEIKKHHIYIYNLQDKYIGDAYLGDIDYISIDGNTIYFDGSEKTFCN